MVLSGMPLSVREKICRDFASELTIMTKLVSDLGLALLQLRPLPKPTVC